MFRIFIYITSCFVLIFLSTFYSVAQTLSVTQNIQFGEVAYVASPGTVTISSGNVRTSSGTYVKSASTYSRGAVNFTATKRRTNVTLTVGNTTLTRVGGGSLQFAGGSTTPIGATVNNGNTTTFYFGGTITLTSSLPAGIYSGSYSLTFNYN